MISYHYTRDGADAQANATKGDPLMIPDNRMPPKLAANVRKVNLIVPSDLLDRVDNFRRHLPSLPNRSVALRKLVEMGLEVASKGEKKPKKG
jgi:hypothetical protein